MRVFRLSAVAVLSLYVSNIFAQGPPANQVAKTIPAADESAIALKIKADKLVDPFANATAADPLKVKEALQLYREASTKGNGAASAAVARMYEVGLAELYSSRSGRLAVHHYQDAAKWHELAYQQGDSHSAYESGRLHESGFYAAPNKKCPVDVNFFECQTKCASCKPDYTGAVAWYRKGAEAWDFNSLYALGRAYREGKGVESDPIQAVKWYALAEFASDLYRDPLGARVAARKALREMTSPADKAKTDIMKAQFDQGIKEAKEWAGLHPKPAASKRIP